MEDYRITKRRVLAKFEALWLNKAIEHYGSVSYIAIDQRLTESFIYKLLKKHGIKPPESTGNNYTPKQKRVRFCIDERVRRGPKFQPKTGK